MSDNLFNKRTNRPAGEGSTTYWHVEEIDSSETDQMNGDNFSDEELNYSNQANINSGSLTYSENENGDISIDESSDDSESEIFVSNGGYETYSIISISSTSSDMSIDIESESSFISDDENDTDTDSDSLTNDDSNFQDPSSSLDVEMSENTVNESNSIGNVINEVMTDDETYDSSTSSDSYDSRRHYLAVVAAIKETYGPITATTSSDEVQVDSVLSNNTPASNFSESDASMDQSDSESQSENFHQNSTGTQTSETSGPCFSGLNMNYFSNLIATAAISLANPIRSWFLSECSICFNIMLKDHKVTFLPCFHYFHTVCITRWLEEHDTCPICRQSLID